MRARWITAALLLLASPVVGQEPVIESGSRIRVEAPSELESRGVGNASGGQQTKREPDGC